jgi:hypothetical protein
MAWSTAHNHGETPKVTVADAGDQGLLIEIRVGQSGIMLRPQEAAAVRDDLSRAITEFAQQHAQAIAESEGAQA